MIRQLQDFMVHYAEWEAQREALNTAEASGKPPRPDDWHHSDDTGVEMLQELVAIVTLHETDTLELINELRLSMQASLDNAEGQSGTRRVRDRARGQVDGLRAAIAALECRLTPNDKAIRATDPNDR